MKELEQFLKPAEIWDRKYLSAAREAITVLSPTEEKAERRIKKYLSKDRRGEFNLANPHSRALFRRHLLSAASEWEDKLYKLGRVVMMATFVDEKWAFPDHEIEFDFKAAKQKVRNAFEGFDYIGAFEPAVYPGEELTTESGTGSLVSFHAHVIAWSTSETKLRAHKSKIAKRFTPVFGDDALSFPTLHNLKTTADFRTMLRYVTKMPAEGYQRVEQNGEICQRHAKLENVHYFWLIGFLRHHTVFDAWFAGGEGSQILKSAKAQSIDAANTMARTNDELAQVIAYLRGLWDDGASSRSEDALHRYCAAVLSEYRNQMKRDAAVSESIRMVQLAKVKKRLLPDCSIRRIISATSDANDYATNRITRALRYGYLENWLNVEAELRKNGGTLGCARKFQALKKNRNGKRKRRWRRSHS